MYNSHLNPSIIKINKDIENNNDNLIKTNNKLNDLKLNHSSWNILYLNKESCISKN